MRAVIMFLIAMGARITGRIYDMMTALSVTAMMILLESPAYLLDSGFLLSFGCVLGIGVAAEKICALAGAEKKWTKALVSSMALQLVTLPVMLKFLEKYPLPDFSESSGASKCGLCADGRNGGTVAWNFQYFCCKTGNFAGKGTAAFMNIYVALQEN